MDDLISSFSSMNTWDSEKNYLDLVNSIENASCILDSENPTIESIESYINFASNRYIYMTKFIFFDDIKEKLQEFFKCSNDLNKIRISYDIDLYIYNYINYQ
jgi:hypothetical protein